MTAKQSIGKKKEILVEDTAQEKFESITSPCSGGISAPPTIAKISPADASFASLPTLSSASPYMLGNIIDMHADTVNGLKSERDSQKAMLIGKDASMIRRIKAESLADFRRIFPFYVILDLQVRVNKNWRQQDSRIGRFR